MGGGQPGFERNGEGSSSGAWDCKVLPFRCYCCVSWYKYVFVSLGAALVSSFPWAEWRFWPVLQVSPNLAKRAQVQIFGVRPAADNRTLFTHV